MLRNKKTTYVLVKFLTKNVPQKFLIILNPGVSLSFNSNLPILSILIAAQAFSEQETIHKILPGCSLVEKNSYYLNFQGKVQVSRKIFSQIGLAKPDWQSLKIVLLLLEKNFSLLNKTKIDFSTLEPIMPQSHRFFFKKNFIFTK